MLGKLKNGGATRAVTRYDILECAAEYTNEFFALEGEDELTPASLITPELTFDDSLQNVTIDNYEIPSVDSYYFNKLCDIYYILEEGWSVEVSMNKVSRHITGLRKLITANGQLSPGDKDRLFGMISVFSNSLDYWLENISEWSVVINGEEYGPMTRGFWGNLGRAALKTAFVDGAGALVGSLVPGGTVIGAATASFVYAATKLIESIDDIIG